MGRVFAFMAFGAFFGIVLGLPAYVIFTVVSLIVKALV